MHFSDGTSAIYVGPVSAGDSMFLKNTISRNGQWTINRDGSVRAPSNGVLYRLTSDRRNTAFHYMPARDLVADQRRQRGKTDWYEPDIDALKRAKIPDVLREELFEKWKGFPVEGLTDDSDALEVLCFGCLASQRKTYLCLHVSEVQHGPLVRNRTVMHFAHVWADSEMRASRITDPAILNHIRNARPCCANCNGDMQRHNMFDCKCDCLCLSPLPSC